MINEHTNAIIQAIKSEFNLKVYDETLTQGFKMPCFHVLLITPSIERKNIHNYDFNLQYIVKYFTDNTDDPHGECIDIYTRLCILLECINGSNCNKFNYNYQDGVLSVECNYKLRGLTLDEIEKMYDYKLRFKDEKKQR